MSDRNHFVYEAVAKGWKNILDCSGTGSGKSYLAGLLEPEAVRFPNQLGKDQEHLQKTNIWYFTKESRNPSTFTVEANFELLPVRHNDMIPRKDEQGKLLQTPLGNLVTTPALDSTYPDRGNCKYANLFQAIGGKNFVDEGQIEATNHPICRLCPHNVQLPSEKGSKCTNHEGEGYGFRKERKDAMASDRLRLNPLSAPAKLPQNLLAVWEEIATLNTPQRFLGTLSDLDASIGVLLSNDDGMVLLEKLSPILKELRNQLSEPSNRWGCTTEMFQKRVDLSSFNQESRVQILQSLESLLKPSLAQIAETDSIDNLEDRKRGCSFEGQEAACTKKTAKLEAIERIEKAPNHILWDFLNVLFFDGVGRFRIYKGSIVLTLPGSRVEEIVKAVEGNLFLDATIEPQLLKAQLGVDNLLVCRLDQPTIGNQRHIQISGFGNCRRDRAQSTNTRLKKLYPAIRAAASAILGVAESDLRVAIADYKNVTSIKSDLQHLSNTRGSNKITGYEVLVVHGLPKPNQGAVEDEYACISNSGFTFDQYYQARCDAEIRQLAGRQRIDRYPNRNFLVYWITEEVLPFETEHIDAIEICHDAAPSGQKTAKSIFEAIVQCVQSGWKLTQKLIAQLAECTQGYISQWFAARGGWSFWKNLLRSKQPEELEQYRSQLNTEEQVMVEELPLMLEDASDDAKAVINAVNQVFQVFGAEAFARIWKGVSQNVQARFIAALLAIDDPKALTGRVNIIYAEKN